MPDTFIDLVDEITQNPPSSSIAQVIRQMSGDPNYQIPTNWTQFDIPEPALEIKNANGPAARFYASDGSVLLDASGTTLKTQGSDVVNTDDSQTIRNKVIDAADGNTIVLDPSQQSIGAIVRRTTNLAISNTGGSVNVPWNIQDYGTTGFSWWSSGTDLTIPTAGIWLLVAHVKNDDASQGKGYFIARFLIGGGAQADDGSWGSLDSGGTDEHPKGGSMSRIFGTSGSTTVAVQVSSHKLGGSSSMFLESNAYLAAIRLIG